MSRCLSASDALLLESGSLSDDRGRDREHETPRADEAALADGIWSWGWHDDDGQEQSSVVAAESGNGTPEVSQHVMSCPISCDIMSSLQRAGAGSNVKHPTPKSDRLQIHPPPRGGMCGEASTARDLGAVCPVE